MENEITTYLLFSLHGNFHSQITPRTVGSSNRSTFRQQYYDCYPLPVKPQLPTARMITATAWWLCSEFACGYLNVRKRHRYKHTPHVCNLFVVLYTLSAQYTMFYTCLLYKLKKSIRYSGKFCSSRIELHESKVTEKRRFDIILSWKIMSVIIYDPLQSSSLLNLPEF